MKADIDPVLDSLTQQIIGAAFIVCRTLGHGFLETVYRNALQLELLAAGLEVEKEKSFAIYYREERVGLYIADIVVNNKIVVELKAVEGLSAAHGAQVLNYLQASRMPVGLLLNFGKPRVEMRRVIL